MHTRKREWKRRLAACLSSRLTSASKEARRWHVPMHTRKQAFLPLWLELRPRRPSGETPLPLSVNGRADVSDTGSKAKRRDAASTLGYWRGRRSRHREQRQAARRRFHSRLMEGQTFPTQGAKTSGETPLPLSVNGRADVSDTGSGRQAARRRFHVGSISGPPGRPG